MQAFFKNIQIIVASNLKYRVIAFDFIVYCVQGRSQTFELMGAKYNREGKKGRGAKKLL